MDPRALELLNLELDGRLDAAGRAELEARLAAAPELRAHREQLRAVARALAEAPAPGVPPGFAQELLRRAGAAPAARRPRGGRRYWRGVLALAASLMAVALVLRVGQHEPPGDAGQMAATLAPAVPTVAAEAAPDGLRLTFDIPPGPAGELRIEFTDGERIVVPAGPGRKVVTVAASAGGQRDFRGSRDFRATLVRNGVATAVARREP